MKSTLLKPQHADERVFELHFRHLRNLSPKLGVRAITTCVITVTDKYGIPLGFTAIGNAICWASDNFSRRFGRRKAFANALDHCGLLKDYRLDLFAAFMDLDPEPCHEVRKKLPDAVKRARWEAGWEIRQARALKAVTREAAAMYYNAGRD